MKIVMIHYRYLPSLAGVELVMGEQARCLVAAGHEVTILIAAGEAQGRGEAVVRLEALAQPSPEPGSAEFSYAVAELEQALEPWCAVADRVVVHNVLTMPFHLAATAAIWRLVERLPAGRVVNWVHDLTPGGEAGSLLCRADKRVPVVAVSDWRAEQYLALTGCEVQAVVPNGIDPLGLLPLTEPVRQLAQETRLLEAGLVLFQPARLVPRKRVEVGLRLVAELRASGGWEGREVRLLITAAPDEHRSEAALYREELRALRRELGLEREVLFVHEHFPVAHADLLALYSLADVLWFPSQQEGFGLPVVEGALQRLPVFCADLPPMNRFRLPGLGFFDPTGSPAQIAEELRAFLEPSREFLGARKAAVQRFSWEQIAPQFISILAEPFPQSPCS